MGCVKRRIEWRSIFGPVPAALIAIVVISVPPMASAFDLFGLFGSDEPPQPSPTTLPYKIEFVVHDDHGVKYAVQESSNFYKLRQDPPPDGEALAGRLNADFAPMIDALWGEGYYNARIFAAVDAIQVELGQDSGDKIALAANAYKGRAVVPVTITVNTGPQFRLRNIAVVDLAAHEPLSPDVLPARIVKLRPGDPAKAADLRAANARLIDHFRMEEHPLVMSRCRSTMCSRSLAPPASTSSC